MIITYNQGMRAFTALFWFKVITSGLFIYFIFNYKNHEFYYYKNLGLSKLFLCISTSFFDMILFISLLILTLKFR